MKCFKCSKDASVIYPNGDLCGDCFLEILVNRVKKEVRAECPVKKNEKILIFGKLARYFLERIIQGLPVTITEADEPFSIDVLLKNFSEYDKVVIPWTADDEAILFFDELITANPAFDKIGHSKKIIKLFKSVLDNEVQQAAMLLAMDHKTVTRNDLVEKIQKKYPSAKFGLVKSASEFKKALE